MGDLEGEHVWGGGLEGLAMTNIISIKNTNKNVSMLSFIYTISCIQTYSHSNISLGIKTLLITFWSVYIVTSLHTLASLASQNCGEKNSVIELSERKIER